MTSGSYTFQNYPNYITFENLSHFQIRMSTNATIFTSTPSGTELNISGCNIQKIHIYTNYLHNGLLSH